MKPYVRVKTLSADVKIFEYYWAKTTFANLSGYKRKSHGQSGEMALFIYLPIFFFIRFHFNILFLPTQSA